MNKKRIITKLLVLLAWVMVIGGITTLLVAANRKSNGHQCSAVQIRIKGSAEKFYIEQQDIQKSLEKAMGGKLVNRTVNEIPLAMLERSLEKNQWIKDAELYFDRDEVLHVLVEERIPIARVFSTAGNSFYIDSTGHRMPLIEKMSARVPVITGYSLGTRLSTKDSAFLGELKHLASLVYASPFWNAQVGQIDISADRKFELIPVIGDHVIRLGSGEKLEDKFGRLELFYKKVLSSAGFNKYAAIDVQFDGQVVGVYRGAVSPVDSIQLQKNIEELLKKSTIENVSADMLPADSVQKLAAVNTSGVAAVSSNPTPVRAQAVKADSPVKPANRSNPTVVKPKPVKPKPKPAAPGTRTQPKAVMQRRA